MRTLSHLTVIAALALATPAQAQFTKRVAERIKTAASEKKRQTEENAVNRAAEPTDSAMARAAAPVESLTTQAGREAGAAVSRVGRGNDSSTEEELRIRQELTAGRADLPHVTFEPGGNAIAPASDPSLRALVRIMTESPGVFLIQVRPDSGDTAHPPQLAGPRAFALKSWLASNGIPAERIFAAGEAAAGPSGALVTVALMR